MRRAFRGSAAESGELRAERKTRARRLRMGNEGAEIAQKEGLLSEK
jgi:hypothetical protein